MQTVVMKFSLEVFRPQALSSQAKQRQPEHEQPMAEVGVIGQSYEGESVNVKQSKCIRGRLCECLTLKQRQPAQ